MSLQKSKDDPKHRRRLLTLGDVIPSNKTTSTSQNVSSNVNSNRKEPPVKASSTTMPRTKNITIDVSDAKADGSEPTEASENHRHRHHRHRDRGQQKEEKNQNEPIEEQKSVDARSSRPSNVRTMNTVRPVPNRHLESNSRSETKTFLTKEDLEDSLSSSSSSSIEEKKSATKKTSVPKTQKTKAAVVAATSTTSTTTTANDSNSKGATSPASQQTKKVGGNRKRESLSKSPKNLTKSDFSLICKNVPDMCVPLKCASEVSKATWQNFFPAIKKDGTAVYVFKIVATHYPDDHVDPRIQPSVIKQYKMVDYGPLRMFFTGAWKKFPAKDRPADNYFEYKDAKLGTVKFVYWTSLFETERAKENLSRKLKKQQKTTPIVDINDEKEEKTRSNNEDKTLKRKRSAGGKKDTVECERLAKVRVVEIGDVKKSIKVGPSSNGKKKRGSSSSSPSSSSSGSYSSFSRSTSGSYSSYSSSSSSHSSSESVSNDEGVTKKNKKDYNPDSESEIEIEIDLSSKEEKEEKKKESFAHERNSTKNNKSSSKTENANMLTWVRFFMARERELVAMFLEKGCDSLVFNPAYLEKIFSKEGMYALFTDITEGRVKEETDERFLIFQTFLIALHVLNMCK